MPEIPREEREADALIAALPPVLRADPGLTFSQARAARRAEDLDHAAALITAATKAGAVDLAPDDWWRERHIVTRMLLERGDWGLVFRALQVTILAGAGAMATFLLMDAKVRCHRRAQPQPSEIV